MLDIYGIKNCDSVKKALKFFKQNDIPYKLHDFKEDSVSCDKIQQWLKDVDIKLLFNSRSTTYRTLKLKEKNLNDDEKTQYLCDENLLIKRPVIEYKDTTIVGFDEEKYRRTFL